MTLIHRFLNLETQEITERPYNEKELKEAEEIRIKQTEFETKEAQAAAAKAALLEKLGITEEEVKLLLS